MNIVRAAKKAFGCLFVPEKTRRREKEEKSKPVIVC
jgi:hypothetical protein